MGVPRVLRAWTGSLTLLLLRFYFQACWGGKREAAGWRGVSERLEGAAEWGLNWALGSCGVQMGRRKGAVLWSLLLGGESLLQHFALPPVLG